MRKSRLYAGLLAPVVAFLGIVTAAYLNRSWWRFTENSLSDLGRLGLPHNWIFSGALVLTAVLALYYAWGLWETASNAAEKTGAATFIVGLLFLMAIGLFPEGTSPHYYVSWGFFLASAAGIAIFGAGFILSGKKKLGLATFVLLAAGIPLTFWAKGHFTGVAVAETVGAMSIALWHYSVLLTLAKTNQ